MERYFWISLPYATFGVGVTGGRVTSAAPIAAWALGKEASVLSFYRRKGAEIVEITKMIENMPHKAPEKPVQA
jgi:hypothetical protein